MKDGLYRKIREKIVLLDYKPGQALVLNNLAKQFGTSVTPVREALIRLESENLVLFVPNNSIRVTEISFQDLKDVFEVRLFLAGKAGKLAAQRITEAELDRIKKLVGKMKQEKDRRELIRLDSEVHDLINQATKNRALAKVLEMLRNQVVRLWFFAGNQGEYMEGMAKDFENLLVALKIRDVNASKQILQDHVIRFIEQVKEATFESTIFTVSSSNTTL